MPLRPKKKIERRGEAGLTGPEVEGLLTGDCVLDHDRPAFPSEQARREAWARHRDFLLSLQGKEAHGETFGLPRGSLYFGLFERPSGWWDYSSPGPRRLLRGDAAAALPGMGLARGVPRFYVSHDAWKALTYESEKEYLIRLGLLTEGEKATLLSTGDTTKH